MTRQQAEGSTSKTKGSPRPSCETCRLRRIKCVRPEELQPGQDPSCDACKRKEITCVFVDRPKTRKRTGKNVEEARKRYGSIIPSNAASPTSKSPSPQLAVQTRMVEQELARSFGDKLFELWLDQTQLRENWPPLDLPVVDFWALRSRYRSVGNSLELLDNGDQLLYRLVYAVAAPMFLPEHLSSNSRSDIATKFFKDAEQAADSLAIWRKIDRNHCASLVFFHKALATRNANHEEAPAYLAAAVHQLRTLSSKRVEDAFVDDLAGASRLSWCTAVVDVLSAAERRTKPCLTRAEYSEYLGRGQPILPDLAMLQEMLQISAEATTSQILDALFVLVVLASDISNFVSTPSGGGVDSTSLFWQRLDEIYSWCQGALSLCSITPGQGTGVCQVGISHLFLSYVGPFNNNFPRKGLRRRDLGELSHARVHACRIPHRNRHSARHEVVEYVRNARPGRTYEICSTAKLRSESNFAKRLQLSSDESSCSISRVIDFAEAFSGASSSDLSLFPQGSTDKYASLEYLVPQLVRLSEAYPSTRMTSVLDVLQRELSSLRIASDDSDQSIFELLPTPSVTSSTETLPFFSPEFSTLANPSPPSNNNVDDSAWDWKDLIQGDNIDISGWEQLSNSLGQQ
ncbi:hypothetical protein JCM3765_007700 [Sporobolomyces pararoseus]